MLMRSEPEAAERLLALAQADADERWRYYTQLAGLERSVTALPGRRAASGPACAARGRGGVSRARSRHPLPRPGAAEPPRRVVLAPHREPRLAASPRGRRGRGGRAPVALRGGDHRGVARGARRPRGRRRELRRGARLPPRARLLRDGPRALSRARGRGEARAPGARDREPERRHAGRLARIRAPRRGGRRRRPRAQPLPGGGRPGALQRGARSARPRARGGDPRGIRIPLAVKLSPYFTGLAHFACRRGRGRRGRPRAVQPLLPARPRPRDARSDPPPRALQPPRAPPPAALDRDPARPRRGLARGHLRGARRRGRAEGAAGGSRRRDAGLGAAPARPGARRGDREGPQALARRARVRFGGAAEGSVSRGTAADPEAFERANYRRTLRSWSSSFPS